MKRSFKLLSVLMIAAIAVFSIGCKDDGPVIGGGDGIPVSDGMYITKAGVDPVPAQKLNTEKVELGFDSQDREGFQMTFVYLEAGDYNLVTVTDRAITETLGGTAIVPEGDTYSVIEEAAVDGAAFNVATAGLYVVSYDLTLNEIVYLQITSAGAIGDATATGWGADTELTVKSTATADGISFETTGMILRQGSWKVRFNNRWIVDRRLDPSAGHDFANGYAMFTNLSGTVDAPVLGGSNFAIAAGDDAEFTVALGWTPTGGWAITLTRTGDAPVVTFVPSEHQWGIIGSATTIPDWSADIDLNYEGLVGTTYSWVGTFDLTVGSFKFRTNDSWDKNFGYDGATKTGDLGDLSADNDGNFSLAVAGNYTITISTSDDGATYSVDFQLNQ